MIIITITIRTLKFTTRHFHAAISAYEHISIATTTASAYLQGAVLTVYGLTLFARIGGGTVLAQEGNALLACHWGDVVAVLLAASYTVGISIGYFLFKNHFGLFLRNC